MAEYSERAQNQIRKIESVTGMSPWEILCEHSPDLWSQDSLEKLYQVINKARKKEVTLDKLVKVLLENSVASQSRPDDKLSSTLGAETTDEAPIHDPIGDERFAKSVLASLGKWMEEHPIPDSPAKRLTGHEAIPEIIQYLTHGCPPNQDGRTEAHFLDNMNVKTLIETKSTEIIITREKLNPALGGDKRPIEMFFDRWIRNATLKKKMSTISMTQRAGTRTQKTWTEVRTKLLHDEPQGESWNFLDEFDRLPPSTPSFLSGPKSQLFTRICEASDGRAVNRQGLYFMLLSCGGCHTSSHVDATGIGVYLNIHEGLFGFGWIAVQNIDDVRAWHKGPLSVKHLARYVVLRPGQTIFFPTGTIHFVFRLEDHYQGQTFGTGGNILLWHGIMDWLTVLRRQELDKSGQYGDVTAAFTRPYVKTMLEMMNACITTNDVEDVGVMEEAIRIAAILKDWTNFKPDQEI
ncbi:hypothetical protein ACHAP5_010881 [Fusarium lateritium]